MNTLVDESDPDIQLPRIAQLLQTAEAIRADGHPAYRHLADARDEAILRWVQAFNPQDLHSKNPSPPRLTERRLCCEDLLAKHQPSTPRL
jgi:hypothetical protein